MVNRKFKADFVEDESFHVYSRTNNKEVLFRNDDNRYFFLRKYDQLTSAFLKTYSWILLPTHFHFLIKIKNTDSIVASLRNKSLHELCKTEKKFLAGKNSLHDLINNSFRRLLISYSMAFNSAQERKGNLFHRPIRHIRIEDDSQFSQAIIYINANAQKHKLVKEFRSYKWSSYHTLISTHPTKLCRDELLDWFGGKEQFIKTMKDQSMYYYKCDSITDDD